MPSFFAATHLGANFGARHRIAPLMPPRADCRPQCLEFKVRLAMADVPPVCFRLDILDAAGARDAMLKMTWSFVAFRRQSRRAQLSGSSSRVATSSAAGSAAAGDATGEASKRDT